MPAIPFDLQPTVTLTLDGQEQHWHASGIELGSTLRAGIVQLERSTPTKVGERWYRPGFDLTVHGIAVRTAENPSPLNAHAAAALLDLDVTRTLVDVLHDDASHWVAYYTDLLSRGELEEQPSGALAEWAHRRRQLSCLAAAYAYADQTARAV